MVRVGAVDMRDALCSCHAVDIFEMNEALFDCVRDPNSDIKKYSLHYATTLSDRPRQYASLIYI